MYPSAPPLDAADPLSAANIPPPPYTPTDPNAQNVSHVKSSDPDHDEFETLDHLPPPAGPSFVFNCNARRFVEIPPISETSAKEALASEASNHFRWQSSAVNKLSVVHMEHCIIFHYTLETFHETRSISYVTENYAAGAVLDSPACGRAPGPWELPCNPKTLFVDQVVQIPVPHTSTLTVCKGCSGAPQIRCLKCVGQGVTRCGHCFGFGVLSGKPDCLSCHGRGFSDCFFCSKKGEAEKTASSCMFCSSRGFKNCEACNAQGKNRSDVCCPKCQRSGKQGCSSCSGRGFTLCKECKGSGQLRQFARLTVTFKNSFEEYWLNEAGAAIPKEKLAKAGVTELLQDMKPMLEPLSNYPVAKINEESLRLLNSHRDLIHTTQARLIHQRQRLVALPVAKVSYVYEGMCGEYFVYGEGKEKQVHIEKYPATHSCVLL